MGLLSPKRETSGDLTTTSLTLAFAVRFSNKVFGFSPIPLSKAGCGPGPHASLVSLLSPWSVDCGRVPRFPLGLGALVSGVSWAQRCKLFHNCSNSAPISPLLLNTYSFGFAASLLAVSSLSSGEGEANILSGVLVLGGWGACCGCFPRFCGVDGPFLELGLPAKGSAGSALAGGHFSVLARCRGGPEGSVGAGGSFQSPNIAARGPKGPIDIGGSFQSPNIAARGSQGPRLLRGLHLRLVLAPTAPQGPRAIVSCQDSWGMRAGARDVRRDPCYYVVGYSGICAGGQVQSQFP